MKKLITVFALFMVAVMLGVQDVFAAEGDVVVEPTAFDNWIDVITDFASLKNFVVTTASVSGLIALIKLRGAWKFFKSDKGIATIETIGFNIIKKVSKSPELVMSIIGLVTQFPIVKQILANAQRKADLYEVELQGKILDIEAKLSAGIFEGNKLQEATAYLTKLREEYETIQPSE